MLISKSKFLDGLKCHKLLWHRCHSPDLFAALSSGELVRFDEGKKVGELAKSLFPGGIDLELLARDLTASLEATKRALSNRRPVFEATFCADGLLVKTDLLTPNDSGGWNLIEVKSSTEVKAEHILDAAFQFHVLTTAGVRVDRVELMHVNKEYVRHGEIDPEAFFIQENVSQQVRELQAEVQGNVECLRSCVNASLEPSVEIGPRCHAPYPCPLTGRCWKHVPSQSVFNLYRIGAKAWRFYEQGITRLADVSRDENLTGRQGIQLRACQTKEPHIDKEAIGQFLETVKYPAYFLDFETYSTAIPLIDNCRPYQQIPFQFSLHIQDRPNAEPEHHSFLAVGTVDPRPQFMKALERLLGGGGSIIVYNKSFEISRLRECATLLPVYKDWVRSLETRIVDLLVPFRSFNVYHPDQNGSCSIKAVLPAWTDLSYSELEIKDGGTASNEYLRVTFGEVSPEEEVFVRRHLEEYCRLDTLAMLELLKKLGLQ